MQLASPRHFNSNEDNHHHNEMRNVEMIIRMDMIVDCEGVLFIAQTGVTYPVVFGKFSGAKMASLVFLCHVRMKDVGCVELRTTYYIYKLVLVV